jgi:P-type E1-E2 ATPase
MILYQNQQKSHPLAILGSPALLAEIGWNRSPEMAEKLADEQAAGRSILIFAEAGQGSPAAIFSFDETLRPDARQAIAELKSSRKIGRISILTGDHPQAAARLATELGVEYQAALLPHEKQEIVAFDRATGHRVGFVGEGYNDAPAMALADVGLALGAGADLTRDNASVCILGNDIAAVPWVLGLSRRTVRQIRRNLFWAFFYNIIGLVFATLGLLSPTMAAAIMFVSSVAVVSGSWQKSVPGTTSAPEAFPAEVSREWPSTAH